MIMWGEKHKGAPAIFTQFRISVLQQQCVFFALSATKEDKSFQKTQKFLDRHVSLYLQSSDNLL